MIPTLILLPTSRSTIKHCLAFGKEVAVTVTDLAAVLVS